MFLSNWATIFLLTFIFALFVTSCGSSPANVNSNAAPISTGKSEFPFATKEPEIFQANFFVTSGGSEKRWFLARSGDRWRFDIFRDGQISLTQLRTDKLYLIDHVRRSYCVIPQTPGLLEPPDPILSGFFNHRRFRRFEDLGIDSGLHKYKVRTDEDSKEDIIILIDPASGMIVRQEFYEGIGEEARLAVTYEVRDLKLSVEDGILSVPDGFRLIAYDEFQRSRGNKHPGIPN